MSFTRLAAVGGGALLGVAIYLHLMYRTRRLRGVWVEPATTSAQRWARGATIGGLLLFVTGLVLLGVASGEARPWLRMVATALAGSGYIVAMAGGFAVGYTSDSPSSRLNEALKQKTSGYKTRVQDNVHQQPNDR